MKNIRTYKKRARIGFDGIANSVDESRMDLKYATLCHNFVFSGGALKGEIGIDTASGYYAFPSRDRHAYADFDKAKKIRKAFLYRKLDKNGLHDDRLVAHLSDGTFWYTNVFWNEGWNQVPSLVMDGDVEAVNYNYNGEDVLLLCSSDDGLFLIKDTSAYACSGAPKFTSIAIHSERVFGSVNGTKNQVWFSDDFDPANWKISESEAGYINFADDFGEAIKVVSFLGYLYVFREYGIFRLTAYGDQNDFLMKKVFTDTGRIYKDSIVLCGDKIMFCAEDGVFAFDGYDVTMVAKEIPIIKNRNTMCCAYLDNNYYLACNLEECEGNKNNAIVKFDTERKEISVLDNVFVSSFCTVKTHNGSDVLCCFEGDFQNRLGMLSKSGCVFLQPTKKVYKSPKTILGDTRLKIVREVSLVSKYPVTVGVDIDGKIKKIKVKGSDKLQKIPIEKSGYRIAFDIESDSQEAYVANMNVYFEVAKGEV